MYVKRNLVGLFYHVTSLENPSLFLIVG